MESVTLTQRKVAGRSHHKPRRPVPAGVGRAPRAPADLTASAADEWRRVVPRMMALGVLPDLDLAVMRLYVCAVGDLTDVRGAWLADGSPATVARPDGPRAHPAISTVRQLSADVLKYAQALGLTPRARRALGIELGTVIPEAQGMVDDDDPLSRYFS